MFIAAFLVDGVVLLALSFLAFEAVRRHPLSPESKVQELKIMQHLKEGDN